MATREFGGRVPEQQFDLFKSAFPQYGAVNWFINQSLEALNRRVKANPGIKNVIDLAIDDMLDQTLERSILSEPIANARPNSGGFEPSNNSEANR